MNKRAHAGAGRDRRDPRLRIAHPVDLHAQRLEPDRADPRRDLTRELVPEVRQVRRQVLRLLHVAPQ